MHYSSLIKGLFRQPVSVDFPAQIPTRCELHGYHEFTALYMTVKVANDERVTQLSKDFNFINHISLLPVGHSIKRHNLENHLIPIPNILSQHSFTISPFANLPQKPVVFHPIWYYS